MATDGGFSSGHRGSFQTLKLFSVLNCLKEIILIIFLRQDTVFLIIRLLIDISILHFYVILSPQECVRVFPTKWVLYMTT